MRNSGDVLAMVSAPDQLLDRARYGQYPPGSTFKLVTAMAALRLNPQSAKQTYSCSRLPDGRTGTMITGWNRPIRDDIKDHAHGTLDMEQAITVSCNAYFAQLGVFTVGSAALRRMTESVELQPGDPANFKQMLPFSAYGQGPVLATPFKMARVAATIADGGQMPQGRWVIDSSNGRTNGPRRVVSEESARVIADAMRNVVTNGTGRQRDERSHAARGRKNRYGASRAGGAALLVRGLRPVWRRRSKPDRFCRHRRARRIWIAGRCADRPRSRRSRSRPRNYPNPLEVRVPLSDLFEKLGRAIFEAPFTASRISADVPELAEIRLVAIDAIKNKSHRVAGKLVFPFNLVRIHLSGVPENQAETFRSEFMAQYFDQELRAGLARANYRYPDDLRVQLETTPELPGPKETWIRVEAESIARVAAPSLIKLKSEGALVVTQGRANQDEVVLNKTRTNIGRTVDVFTNAGPSRRNDIAFADDTEINRSVSREHAHILRDQESGEYRIFNDRFYKLGNDAEANCGLWIVRDGRSQPVHRNSRGAALQPGDEIHLGRAILQFIVRPL